MKPRHFLLLTFFYSFFAYGEENCSQIGYGSDGGSLEVIAQTATQECSLGSSDQEICECFKRAPFTDVKVSNKVKDHFHKLEFDQTIREKLAHALKDQLASFTRFSNLLKTKEHLGNVVDESDSLCDLKTISQDIAAVSQKAGTDDCPSPPGFMAGRLREIFGTDRPNEIAQKLNFETAGVKKDSCISTQSYLDLRSNSGAASLGFKRFFAEDSPDMKVTIAGARPADKEAFKDLISYDLFFNLAYKDSEFKDKLEEKISKNKNHPFRVYNDPEVLKAAWKSLNKSCNELIKNVTGFLCANDHPRLPASTAKEHLDGYLANKKMPADEKNALRDFLVKKYSCDPRTAVVYRRTLGQVLRGERKVMVNESLVENEFNQYVNKIILVKNTTEDFTKNDPQSDLNVFNQMFCHGRQGKEISSSDLPLVMQDYLSRLKQEGRDITHILENEELQKKLKLKINTNPISFSLTDQEEMGQGNIAKINQFRWQETMGAELLKAGLSKEEVGQLYAIIEMQTNRKFSEVNDLRRKLIAKNEAYAQLTPAEVLGVMNKDPKIIEQVAFKLNPPSLQKGFMPIISHEEIERSVQDSYQALQNDAQANQNQAVALFKGETTVADLKNDAGGVRIDPPVFIPPVTQNPPPGNESPVDLRDQRANPSENNNRSPASPGNDSLPSTSSIPATSFAGTSPEAVSHEPTSSPRSDSSEQRSAWQSKKEVKYNPDEDSYIQDIRKKLDQTQNRLTEMNKAEDFYKNQVDNLQRRETASVGGAGTQNNSHSNSTSFKPQIDPNYNYPKNVPISDGNGNHFYPEKFGELSSSQLNDKVIPEGELSSSAEMGSGNSAAGASHGAASAAGGAGATSAAGVPSAGALAGISDDLPSGQNKESEEEARKRLELPVYEFPKYIPHAFVHMVGSVDKIVLIMGLEGKKFRTIEALQEFKDGSANADIKYNIRTYDFVPEGEFADMKEDFVTKETRVETFNKYFGFPRNRENMIVSKKYAMGTKEISKVEYPQSYVLKIQSEIMGESELRTIVQSVSDKLK